jgi:hypothetical protein
MTAHESAQPNKSAHWLDRLARRVASDKTGRPQRGSHPGPKRSPLIEMSGHRSADTGISRRSVLRQGLVAASALVFPLRMIKPDRADAKDCVPACEAEAVKHFREAENTARGHLLTDGDSFRVLDGAVLAASIIAHADLDMVRNFQQCSQPNCGAPSFCATGEAHCTCSNQPSDVPAVNSTCQEPLQSAKQACDEFCSGRGWGTAIYWS